MKAERQFIKMEKDERHNYQFVLFAYFKKIVVRF